MAAGAPLVTRSSGASASPDPLDVAEQPGRVEFRLGGRPRWVIDIERFDGSPHLFVRRAEGSVRVWLRGALFPGTPLPADLSCTLTRTAGQWWMHLRLAAGRLEGRLPFAEWLRGAAALAGGVALPAGAWPLGGGARVSLAGRAEASFGPDWTFRLTGTGIGRLEGFGRRVIAADRATVALLAPDAPSAFTSARTRRTLLTLARGPHPWNLLDDLPAGGSGTLGGTDGAFDTLALEMRTGAGGAPVGALIARSRPGAALRFRVGGGHDAGGFDVPLSNARYAAVPSAPSGPSRALAADVGAAPCWAHLGGCSLLLGGVPEGGGFELLARGGRLDRLDLSPAVLHVAAPLSGAVVAVLRPLPGTRLAFAAGGPPEAGLPPSSIGPAPFLTPGPGVTVPNPTLSVLRPEDLLELTFEFANLSLQAGGGAPARLARTDPSAPAYLIVHFPPQHLAERAFFEAQSPSDPSNETPSTPPIDSRLAGPSRLVFALPDGVAEIPYTLNALLDWTALEQSVVATAAPPPPPPPTFQVPPGGTEILVPLAEVQPPHGAGPVPEDLALTVTRGGGLIAHPAPPVLPPPPITQPAPTETAIEAPYRLILSPHAGAAWAHSATPVTHPVAPGSTARTELWHTRLAVRAKNADGTHSADEANTSQRTVRAVWSPDYRPDPQAAIAPVIPFLTSLDGTQRNQLVHLTADLGLAYGAPLAVQNMMLTSLGSWVDLSGDWLLPTGAPIDVQAWTQRNTMGRDQFVRVVTAGYLFPFGHRASVVTITERKIERTPAGDLGAYLRQYKYLIVRQPKKDYPAAAARGRQIPYRSVRITTLVTPHLDNFDESQPFWPQVGGQDVQFGLVAADWDGQASQLTAPLQWIPNHLALDRTALSEADTAYRAQTARSRRPLDGQKVAYAPSAAPGDTTLTTGSVSFGAEIAGQGEVLAAGQPAFFPLLTQAEVFLGAPAQFGASNATTTISLAKTFVNTGFDALANVGETFAEISGTLGLSFADPQKVGGVLTPDMTVTGLSRRFGPVAAKKLEQFAKGLFDPADLFPASAKLLGGIPLSGIASVVDNLGSAVPEVPGMKARVVYKKNAAGDEDPALGPDHLQVDWNWSPRVKSYPDSGNPIFQADRGGRAAALSVTAQAIAPADGKPPTYTVEGRLTDFAVNLLAPVSTFLIVSFNELSFASKSGQKAQVHPDIDSVQFAGALAFVNGLEQFLASKAFGGGVSVDVGPSGVSASMALAVPTLGIGVMSLQNLGFSSTLNLPFTDDPARVRFGVAERDHPFLLTISMFGGGGYFATAVGLDGVESLEASFEFGGALSLDLGVASGGVQVMAGIYYKMVQSDAHLGGFLRCGGHMQVLGLVSVSVEFDLDLTYDPTNNKVWGESSLTVDVSVAFFSVSVSLSVRRQFAGSGGDPTFADLMGPDALLPPGYRNYWAEYAASFA